VKRAAVQQVVRSYPLNRLLYSAYHANLALTAPARVGSRATLKLLEAKPEALRLPLARHLAAASAVVAGTRLTHTRPDFERELPFVDDDGRQAQQSVVDETPFASLLEFRIPGKTGRPKVLLAAPLSGHFATILAPTVRTMLLDHDVYITDWHNARDIPLRHGRFGLDEYVDHLLRFLRVLGPDSHLMAVCQPCAPAVMAVSMLAQEDDAAQPRSLTLMAGPIDTRANPTRINRLAYRQPLARYRRFVTVVPRRYAGAGRLVYPGFLQLSGFMSMNLRRHVDSHVEIYRSLASGNAESSRRTRAFYEEYFAVCDMPAEFYLETLERIFQRDLLPRGEMTHHGRLIEPGRIRNTALLTVEAERDDMCAVGQTAAAHALFTGMAADKHRSYVQEGVGHYGIFAGSRWSREVYPVIRDFIRSNTTADEVDTDAG
jgi:polyhydroxyalkanoate depolymerase